MLTLDDITAYIIPTLIVVLFFGAFVMLLINAINFYRECAKLEELESIIHKNNATYTYKGVLEKLRDSKLVRERFEIVHELCEEHMTFSLSEISNLTISKEEAKLSNQFVTFVTASLLIIGVAGTFWAFRDILTNSGIGQTISKEAINKIYGGFQHAFLASLAGITGTVVLLLVKVWVNWLRESFFSQLDWVTQTRLIPLFIKPNPAERLLLETATKFETAVTHIQSLSQDMKNNVEHAKGLAQELNQLSEKVKDIASLFKDTTGQGSPFYTAVTGLCDVINQSQKRHETLGDNLEKLINHNGELISHNKVLIDQHHEQNEQLKLAKGEFVKIHQQVHQYLAEIDADFKTLVQQHSDETRMVSEGLRDFIAKLERQQVDYVNKQVDYVNSFDLLVRRVKESAQATKDSAQMITVATQQFNVFLDQINQRAQETIPQLNQIWFSGFRETLNGQLQQILQEVMEMMEEKVAEQTRNIQLQLSQIRSNQIDPLKQIGQGMVQLPTKDD